MRARSRRGLTVALILLAGLVPSAPTQATHVETPRNKLTEVGFHGLGNTGFHGMVWPWVKGNNVYVGLGTWGTLTALGAPIDGDPCPSETDNPTAPTKSGVKIVDATDPTNPQLIERIATVPGSQNNEVRTLTDISTPSFTGDLLVHSLEPCGGMGILQQGMPVGNVPVQQTGFQLYNISDPANPVKLGTFNNGGIGSHNVFLFARNDLGPTQRVFVAAVHNETGSLGLLGIRGELQIVEVTNPNSPTLVSSWNLTTPEPDLPCRPRGGIAFCVLHDTWLSDDGKTAYLSFWDAGFVLLDISNPASPQLMGQGLDQIYQSQGADLDEGSTHSVMPYHHWEGREMLIVTDEDYVGGGEIGVTVNSPANLAAFHKATQWDATAPVAGQTGNFVYAGTGCTSAQYVGVNATGRIALVDKFTNADGVQDCPTFLFKQKMDAAENAGAIGVVQIDNNEVTTGGNAVASGIPGLEIANTPGIAIRNAVRAGTTVNATLGRGATINPWGFMRVVDATNPNPAAWQQVFTYEAPHTRDPLPNIEDIFTVHHPMHGPDNRIYLSAYTNGVRVLEPAATPGHFDEVAWFVPRPSDHPNDNDTDPHGAQEDNVGFWGSWPILHPVTGQLLVFNSDLNRGLYILAYETDLRVTKTDSKDPAAVGRTLTYTITVTNDGPGLAAGVTVTDTLPASVNLLSALPSQGSCSGTATITCALGQIASGGSATVTVDVRPTQAGVITNSAMVTASTDTNLANNTDTEQTTICRITSRRSSIPCQ